MATAEQIYNSLLEVVDETPEDERVTCPFCANWASRRACDAYDNRNALNQSLWSHAFQCPCAAKKRKVGLKNKKNDKDDKDEDDDKDNDKRRILDSISQAQWLLDDAMRMLSKS